MNPDHIEKIKNEVTKAQSAADKGDIPELERYRAAICQAIEALDNGTLRVATKNKDSSWEVHAWIKQAILLYFRIMDMQEMSVGPFTYFDKIPLKSNYKELKVRVVPPAVARFGSFMEPGVVLMPSYVNIGAYVGAGTMVDTWATVGSCAQVGKNVHLSGGVGIGGVLEPASARPVIIEDGCFLGSRSIVVEGVHIEEEAVLAANVTLTASTPIIDLRNPSKQELRGRIPKRSVVIPGTMEKKFAHGQAYTACAYIIGERKASTDLKVSLNQTLRDFSISV